MRHPFPPPRATRRSVIWMRLGQRGQHGIRPARLPRWHARPRLKWAAAALSAAALGEPPCVGVVEAIVERLDALLPLALGELLRVGLLEEARRELEEPFGLDGDDLAHVLLCGKHEFVIDEPFRILIEERRRRVDVDDLALIHRLVALLRVLLGRVHEEAATDRAAYLREVPSTADELELVTVHDRQQLLAHVLRAAHRACLDEVFEAPRVGELGCRPRLVHGEIGEVVALWLEEFGALLVGLRLLLLRAVPDVLHGEHGGDGEHLVRAAEVDRLDQDLRERGLHRELSHPPAEECEKALLVQSSEGEERLHRRDERLHGRGVHKVKVHEVVDAHGLHREHGVA
mmetsp:Transcript_34510/g.90808  ORF Transcript_34510/g.90808 Transcript_34510/m.90808 type:complete len:344 (-) Transcript_34510:93-1124(-)